MASSTPTLAHLRQSAITGACWLLGLALRPWSRHRRLVGQPRRVLVIRPCCLGDVVLTTPTLRALNATWPASELDYLVAKGASAGLANHPHARTVLLPESPGGYPALLGRLRARRYDLALVLDRAPQWPLLAWLAGVPIRLGLDSAHRGLALTGRVQPRPGRHEADLAADVATLAGVRVHDERAEYVPSPGATARAAELLAARAPRRPRVVLHPAGGVNRGMTFLAKRWPAERFAQLADRLAAVGAQPVIVGGPDDREVSAAVVAAARFESGLVDLTGLLDLDGLAALAQAADLYVGNDTGPTHLAAAAGAPTVAIFGPTNPAIYGPRGAHVRIVWQGSDRQDTGTDLRSSQLDDAAIQRVTVDDVWAAATALLPTLAAADPA